MKATLNDIVDSLLGQQSRSQVFLQRTRRLDPDDPSDRKILELMRNPSYRDRITGHLINLMTSGERGVFCISIRSLCNSIKDDPNWNRKGKLNAEERKIAFGILRNLVEELASFDMKSATPGIFRIKNPLIRLYLTNKLGIELRELEKNQEQQCRDWIEQKKEQRFEKAKIATARKVTTPKPPLESKLKKRIVEDVLLSSIEGQPIAGRAKAITLACRDILEMKSDEIPLNVFESYDEHKEAECKTAMREACRISLNHWLEKAKDSELENHHRLCELIEAYSDVVTGQVKRSEVRLSFDVADCGNKMLAKIAFGLLGLKSPSSASPSPHLMAVV